jgi:signal peptidase I
LSAAPAKRKSKAYKWVIEIAVIFAAAFVLALLVQQYIVKPFAIPSPSMENTLLEGDRVLVNRLVYHFHPPRRGDVIVFHPPGKPGSDPFIKRVVAVAGDTIAVHDGQLYVNGETRDEPYVKEYPIDGDYPETKIASGYVWAMGDNRNNSGDSRVFGPVLASQAHGRTVASCLWLRAARRAGGPPIPFGSTETFSMRLRLSLLAPSTCV